MPKYVNIVRCLPFTFIFAVVSAMLVSCSVIDDKPTFRKIAGIYYTEVHRTFETGLSFDKNGYQLEPEWRLNFKSDDSVFVFSPKMQKFLYFPVLFDHDSVINMSGVWLRLKTAHPDSLIFQVLKVEGKLISVNRSNVFMTMYADDYIKNKLHTDAKTLQRPTKKDTTYIEARSKIANANSDSGFAARNPVTFKVLKPMISVETVVHKPEVLANTDPADVYLYPEFNITIHKAYKDFMYNFWASVDDKGEILYKQPIVYIMPEFKESTEKTIAGIIDIYLKNWLQVNPGTTLGIPHTSYVKLNIKGIKD